MSLTTNSNKTPSKTFSTFTQAVTALCATAVMSATPISAAFAYVANCKALPSWKAVKEALTKARNEDNGGLNLDMWATVVDRDGIVCAVTYTGKDRGAQWPGSRIISEQKAYTANAFSIKELALSTANLYAPVQTGGSLNSLNGSNLPNAALAYAGSPEKFGTANDPMTGKIIGGIISFGGGLPLYNAKGEVIGAIGVSGDTSCADHNIAWRARHNLELDYVPAGVSADKNDNIVYLGNNEAPNKDFKQPTCGGKEDKVALPATRKAQEEKAKKPATT